MNPLLEVNTLLVKLIAANPTMALASAVACLEPWRIDGWEFDEEDDLFNLLDICRTNFEDLYVQAVRDLWSNKDIDHVEMAMINGINQRLGCYLDEPDQVEYGIPLTCWGLDWYGADGNKFEEGYPYLLPICKWLGCSPINGSVDYNSAFPVVRGLRLSLAHVKSWKAGDLRVLLDWMLGDTDNAFADTPWMVYQEGGEQVGWTPDQMQWFKKVEVESNEIFKATRRAIALLNDEPAWQAAFKKNVKLVRKYNRMLRSAKGYTLYAQQIGINWPAGDTDRHSGTANVAA